MRNFLLIVWLFCASAYAQDSVAKPAVHRVFTSADIAKDTSSVRPKPFARDFKSRYKDDAFNYEPKPAELTAWDRFKAWLASIVEKLFKLGGKGSLDFIGLVFRIIAIVAVIVVIYFIARALFNKEGQWIFGRSRTKRILSADDIEKDIQSADFEKLVAQTLENGDRRLAIRYYYLWVLQRFSQRGIIEWDIEKTNSDYLYEIKSEADKRDFAYLSYLFNYIWYGDFEVDDAAFDKAILAFQKTVKQA